MSQLMVEKRAGNRGARQQSLSRRTAKAVFALKRSGSPCSFLVPFASKTRLTFSRDVGEKPSPYLNGIDRKGRHYYMTTSPPDALVYSSDDPCGRHAPCARH